MRILIVDDQRLVRNALRRMLRRLPDLEVLEAESVDTALAVLEDHVDLMLVDIRLSENDQERGGLTLLRELRRTGRDVPAVIVTSSSALEDLREAMRLGARDYVLKDELSAELIVPIVNGFRERQTLTGEVQRLRAQVESDWGLQALVGSSPAMERVRKLIQRVADAASPVLVVGDTGTGKQTVARALHQIGPRHDEPFQVVSCSAASPIIETTLFGCEKGFQSEGRAKRGRLASAEAGTVLLDEIGDLPMDVQGKLLRVLEEERFLPLGADRELPLRARVVAASNADLARRVQLGQFRSDLYYRLEAVTIQLPPLSQRTADIPELIVAFTEELPRKIRYTRRALEWLGQRPWPGNVRELKNVVRRLSLMVEDEVVDLPLLTELVPAVEDRPAQGYDAIADSILALPEDGRSRYRSIERALLSRALDQSSGNKSAAARLLGLPRKALVRRWERLSIAANDEDEESDD